MSQPPMPAPLAPPTGPAAAVPAPRPPVAPEAAWAPPAGLGTAWPAPVPPAVRPRRRGAVLLVSLLAVAALAALSVLGVQLAVGLRHDAAAAARDADPSGGALAPGAADPLPSAQPAPGLPPSAVPPPTAVLPPATARPAGLGTDPALDGEAQGCFTGDMTACVELYLSSYRDPALARYTAYGDTCAGRQPAGTLRLCTASFPR